MQPVKTVPIPDKMQHLETDRRGYPIPVIVLRDDNGRPHFTINDELKRQLVLRLDQCPISGLKLNRGRWFVGGPLSALSLQGVYIDTPMHYECMEYALKVCPYLAAPNYDKRIDDKTLPKDHKEGMILQDPTMMPDRPKMFVAVMAVGQDYIGRGNLVQYVAPHRPFRRIEFWREGVKLTTAEGIAILREDYAEKFAAQGEDVEDAVAMVRKITGEKDA